MKYKNIQITGHQRTGTHYIAALICTNFLNTKDYVKHYVNHKPPSIVIDDNTAYIYTWRDFENTAKSIFKMRARLGLQVDDYDTFLNTKYSDMWSAVKYGTINVKDLDGNIRKADRVSTALKRINHTPKNWWKLYHKRWAVATKNKSNIIRVSYNDLTTDFDNAMLDIAKRLGSNLKFFKNIGDKIGWYMDVDEEKSNV